MPVSGAPSTRSGGRRPSRQEIEAPIRRRGSAMRSTGRRRMDSSPSSSQIPPGCPASQPGSSRNRVPALPTSTGALAGPRMPTPAMRISAATPSAPSTRAPSASIAARVECVSAESRNPSTALSPSAIAAISAALWEIDLSEGGRRAPRSGPAGSKRLSTRLVPVEDGDRVAEPLDQADGAPGLLGAGHPDRDRPGGHVRRRVEGHVLDVDARLGELQRELGNRPGPIGDDDPQLAEGAAAEVVLEQAAP